MNYSDLIKRRSLQKEPRIDSQQIKRLLERSYKDLALAKRILKEDRAGCLDFLYKAMFHAANALIRSQGYRPGPYRQHQGIVEACRRTLGKEAEKLVFKFDRLRIRRNEFEYFAIVRISESELRNTFQTAEKFIERIEKEIK